MRNVPYARFWYLSYMLRCEANFFADGDPRARTNQRRALPCAALRLSLALSCLAIDVLCSCRLESSLFRDLVVLEQGLVNKLLLVQETASRLVVKELRELEQEGVVNGGRRLLIRLLVVS